jgi:four helix bundle protein
LTNGLEVRTQRFALDVIKLVAAIGRWVAADVIGRQLVKSSTSVGANYREANRAQSREDFITKIAIFQKGAAETEYWLELVTEARLASAKRCAPVLGEAGQLLAIFVASGRTVKARRAASPQSAIGNSQ